MSRTPAPEPPPPRPARDPAALEAIWEANAEAARFYAEALPASDWAPAYLRGDRRLGPGTPAPEALARWNIGYAPAPADGRPALLNHLRRNKISDRTALAAGLARRSSRGTLTDFFRDRVMIPVRDADGDIAGFAGRARPGSGSEERAKYLNTPETIAYKKDRILFGLHRTWPALRAGARRPLLLEGYFDVIAADASGAPLGPVATCGTTLSPAQMALLAACCDQNTTRLLVARDPDPAGKRAAARDYPVISPWFPCPGTVSLPDDPAAVYETLGPDALAGALTGDEDPLADLAVDAILDRHDRRLRWPGEAREFPETPSWHPETAIAASREAAQMLAAAGARVPDRRQVVRIALRTGSDTRFVDREQRDVITRARAARPEPARPDGRAPPPSGSRAAVPARAGVTPPAPAPRRRPARIPAPAMTRTARSS